MENYDPEERLSVIPITTTYRRARIPHDCERCGGTIEPGTKYQRVVVKFDGDIVTVKQHNEGCNYGDYQG